MKRLPTRIVEIAVKRSRKHPRLGHAVAVLFPCSHNRYLGLTLFKGPVDSNSYRTQNCKVIRLDDYEVNDKDTCKLCPYESDFYLDNLGTDTTLDDFVSVLEAAEDEL